MKKVYPVFLALSLAILACTTSAVPQRTTEKLIYETAYISQTDVPNAAVRLEVCRVDPNYGLRLRTQAGQQNPVIRVLKSGEIVTWNHVQSVVTVIPWYQVTVDGVTGFAFSAYLCPISED